MGGMASTERVFWREANIGSLFTIEKKGKNHHGRLGKRKRVLWRRKRVIALVYLTLIEHGQVACSRERGGVNRRELAVGGGVVIDKEGELLRETQSWGGGTPPGGGGGGVVEKKRTQESALKETSILSQKSIEVCQASRFVVRKGASCWRSPLRANCRHARGFSGKQGGKGHPERGKVLGGKAVYFLKSRVQKRGRKSCAGPCVEESGEKGLLPLKKKKSYLGLHRKKERKEG